MRVAPLQGDSMDLPDAGLRDPLYPMRTLIFSEIFLITASIPVVGFNPAIANEPVRPASNWDRLGYIEAPTVKTLAPGLQPERPEWAPHSLEWPVAFQDSEHTIANSLAQFQSYGDGPYFHGGLDLRVSARAQTRTPVAGRIEAGHYGYSNNPDGSMTKRWKPWPQAGDALYFEIAVITPDGYRFEFHHMDEKRIAPDVLKILKSGDATVQVPAGALLGDSIPWPDGEYHHVHYNVITPSGVRLNPEFYSTAIEDDTPPEIKRLLAVTGGKTTDFGTGHFDSAPEFFAIATRDRLGATVYDHPPVHISFEPEIGAGFAWDFRERLTDAEGRFPGIWSFFIQSIRTPEGNRLATEGGYGVGISVVRLPVLRGAQGDFTIRVADLAGGTAEFKGHIGK